MRFLFLIFIFLALLCMALRLPPSHVLSERPRGPFHYRFPHKGEESGEMYSPDEQGEYGTATAASSFTIQGLSDALMALDPEVKPRWNAGRGLGQRRQHSPECPQ